MFKSVRMAVLLAGGAAMIAASCSQMKQIKLQPYPDTARGEVVDDYFGTKVADPTVGSKTTIPRPRPPGSLPRTP